MSGNPNGPHEDLYWAGVGPEEDDMSVTKDKAARAKQWAEEFGDHDCCPECGTDCQSLFVDDVNSGLVARVRSLESVLNSIALAGEKLPELHGPTIARLARSVLNTETV